MGVIMHDDVLYGGKVPTSDYDALIKDTVGWTGKNVIKGKGNYVREDNGVTFTYNSDKTNITVDGENTKGSALYKNYWSGNASELPAGTYVLSNSHCEGAFMYINALNGTTWFKSLGNTNNANDEVEFTVDYDGYTNVEISIEILTDADIDNWLVNPLIRKSSILDDVFEPYHDTVDKLLDDVFDTSKHLLEDTVGWSSKNLLDISSGVRSDQVYYENDKVIVTGGTYANFFSPTIKIKRSGRYRFSTNVVVTSGELNYAMRVNGTQVTEVGITESSYKTTDRDLNVGDEVLFVFRSPNNGIGEFTNVMFRDMSIGDDTYQRYHKSVESELQTKGDWDCRNLINSKYCPISGNADLHGVAIRPKEDGTILINGTTTASSYYIFHKRSGLDDNNPFILPAGTYEVSKEDTKVQFELVKTVDNTKTTILTLNASTTRATFTLDEDTQIGLTVLVESGKTLNNFIFKPMIQLSSNSNKGYTPHRDILDDIIPSKMSYVDNGMLGAKNLLGYNRITGNNGGKYQLTDTGIRVYNEAAQAWSQVIIHDLNLPLNQQFRLTGVADYVSGDIEIVVQGSNDNSAFINIISSGHKTSDFDLDMLFETSIYTYHRLLILCASSATALLGDVTISDLMIRLASDSDDTYVPYAMTNKQLTELATVQESAVTDLIEGAVVVNDLGNHLLKCGKVVYLTLSLNQVNVATSWSDVVFMIPEGYRPKYAHQVRTTLPSDLRLQFNSNGKVLTDKTLTNAGLFLSTSWITS